MKFVSGANKDRCDEKRTNEKDTRVSNNRRKHWIEVRAKNIMIQECPEVPRTRIIVQIRNLSRKDNDQEIGCNRV